MGSNNLVSTPKTLKTRSSTNQFNCPGTCLLCKRKSTGGSVLFVVPVPSHAFSSKGQDLFSHQPLVPTKGYLGVVGAHRATAAPGAVWAAILRGWKQVMPLLLRPRLHEIHHRVVPGEAEKMEDTAGGVGAGMGKRIILPPTCLVILLND